MAVFLSDYVESLQAKVNPPGVDLFPDSTLDEWQTRLANAFWQATLEGTISGFNEDFGQIDPVTDGDDDIGREYIQLIIVYAAIDVLRMYMANIDNNFRAVAGPVEYETSKSATMMSSILSSLLDERNRLLAQLAPIGGTSTYYYNTLEQRDYQGVYDPYNADHGGWTE